MTLTLGGERTSTPSAPTKRKRYENFIGGEWKPSRSGEWAAVVNPARAGETVGEVPRSTPEDVREAIDAAEAAFPEWSRTPMPRRGEFLRKAADLLEQRLEEVAETLTREEGKTLGEARGETARAVSILRYFAGEATQPMGEVYPSAGASTMLYTQR